MKSKAKIKISKVLRTVTAAEAVPFHLRNSLKYTTGQFETVVVGTEVERLKDQFPAVRFINAYIPRKISFIKDLWGLIQLILIIGREKPDVTHSIMPKSGLLTAIAAFICCVPVRMHTFTGQRWTNYTGVKRKFFIFLDKIVVALNTYCLTDSSSQSKYLLDNGIHFKDLALPILGKGSLGGVDFEVFNVQNLHAVSTKHRQELNLGPDNFVFIFVGRKCYDKGVFELIDAFELVNDEKARLILVGPDESNGSLEKRIFSKVQILNLPQTDLPHLYLSLADVFCLPSYREGFGSTVIEAAALGLPTIGTQIAGLKDSVIDGQTGILVPPQNVKELAHAMRTLLQNEALRKKMSAAALENARKNYDAKTLAAEMVKIYQDQFKEQFEKSRLF